MNMHWAIEIVCLFHGRHFNVTSNSSRLLTDSTPVIPLRRRQIK